MSTAKYPIPPDYYRVFQSDLVQTGDMIFNYSRQVFELAQKTNIGADTDWMYCVIRKKEKESE